MRTPENTASDGRCKICRKRARAALYARDTRPKDPAKVRAGRAGAAARDERRSALARIAPLGQRPAPLSVEAAHDTTARLTPPLTPQQHYQLERAKRIAAGKPVLRTIEERRALIPIYLGELV